MIEGYSTDTKRIKSIIKEHIEYEDYLQWIRLFGKDMTTAEIKQLVDKLAKAATSGKGRIINDESFSKYEVQEAVLNLNRACIEMGYETLRKKAPGTVHNRTGYLVSVLIKLGSEYDIVANSEERSIAYDVQQMLRYDDFD